MKVIRRLRRVLLALISKEFLVFLFFLFISGIFWLLMTLNETYEKEVMIGMRMVNVPKNVVIINDVPQTLRVTIRDKGYTIGKYVFGDMLRPVSIDFSNYANGKGYGIVPASDIQKQVYLQLNKSTKVVGMKPEKVEFYYNFGRHKRVPVKMTGHVVPDNSFYLSKVIYSPDSVDVYASKSLLDSIQTAYTTWKYVKGLSDTVRIKAPLRSVRGAKLSPSSVMMTLVPDILTEETADVPIEAINMPDDKVLRTFPSKVKVKFVVGASRLRTMPKNMETRAILPVGFRLVADYNSITKDKGDKCKIYLLSSPSGVRKARPVINEVDYLIEAR